MQTMDQSLQELVKAKRVAVEEALKFAVNKNLFPDRGLFTMGSVSAA